jgi:hypothetical protein
MRRNAVVMRDSANGCTRSSDRDPKQIFPGQRRGWKRGVFLFSGFGTAKGKSECHFSNKRYFFVTETLFPYKKNYTFADDFKKQYKKRQK